MELAISPKGSVEVSDAVFAVEYKEPLIHQVLTAYMAKARAGTKAQKTRSEVRGGGAKPWSQKGTGRARAGTIRSPIWVGGGRAFAAKPRDYTQKVNKKMHNAALRSIVSELIRQERLIVVESLTVAEPKTKLLIKLLADNKLDNKVLMVTEAIDQNLILAARNVPHLNIALADRVEPIDFVSLDKTVITKAALAKLEERLS